MLRSFDHRRYLIPFRSLLLPHIFTDTLVIGGGVAGMRAAIEAAEHGDVILLVKGSLEVSNTWMAQGGIAAAHNREDTPEAHFQDTINAGAGLCDAGAVRTLVEEGPACIDELLGWDMRFDRDASGALEYGREGAHSRPRILHTDGAATGAALVRCLTARCREIESIRIFERCFALDLLTTGLNGNRGNDNRGPHRILGAITHHPQYGLQIIWAKATILATGGAGQVYRETTNPKVATGDGLAMAYRAGAAVGDVEFIQFHPTTLYVAGAGRLLISEAVRGEGAYLVDRDGVRFMPEYHELAELAPRDIVSRAIVDRLAQEQAEAVYLDVRHLGRERFEERFPNLVKELKSFDIDPAVDLIPVHPSAHYSIGGVWTDLEGRTTLPGLLACGEAACNGLHGANRLASNSLLEGLVFGRRAGRAAGRMGNASLAPMKIVSDIPVHEHAELDLVDVRSSLRSAMWRNVGIDRSGRKLDDVQDMFQFWARYTMDMIFDEPAGWETQNLLTVGALITRAATWRAETRGVHYRLDHPEPSDELLLHALWRIGQQEPATRPVDVPAETHA
ncbi:MAG: L-aspartate oxidase [Planctomycetota bacterium]|nr:L-aspartate oxidase [Planctomycetota bacterium]